MIGKSAHVRFGWSSRSKALLMVIDVYANTRGASMEMAQFLRLRKATLYNLEHVCHTVTEGSTFM